MADRISDLPDSVLCHILSFMPTDQAVATSVLSKRWTHLWRSVSALNFHFSVHPFVQDINEAYHRFNEFVYYFLLWRDAVQPMKRFCLKFKLESELHDFSNMNRWVNFVLQRGVKHLELNVILYPEVIMCKLTVSVLRCSTLVVLKLKCFTVKGFSSVALPALKILYLGFIEFAEVRSFMLLLAACPILEDLELYNVDFSSGNSDTYAEFRSRISLNKLTRASTYLCSFSLYNVESLEIDTDQDYPYPGFGDIPSFHNLNHLELIFIKYNWHFLVQVLNHCPKLQNLVLSEVLKELNYDNFHHQGDQENWIDPEFVPECLSLHLRTCSLMYFVGLRGELQFAIYIMKNARVLQTMTINKPGYSHILGEKRQMIERKLSSCPRSSPTCHLSVY